MVHSVSEAETPLLDAQAIGLEGRVVGDSHLSLKLWLRLLSCSTQIETEIRKRLRSEFGMTLARFDYLAQLHRHAEGLSMSALSRFLMVTGGNVTGLTDELAKEGLVARETDRQDRRSFRVQLTPKGRRQFEKLAAVHEYWVLSIFGGLSGLQQKQLHEMLGLLRVQLNAVQNPTPDPGEPFEPLPKPRRRKT